MLNRPRYKLGEILKSLHDNPSNAICHNKEDSYENQTESGKEKIDLLIKWDNKCNQN